MLVSKEKILEFLTVVKDPEVPVLNIVEMGIVRDAKINDKSLSIDITPTYSGCPAMNLIEDQIITALNKKGFDNITINTVLSPAWTTDWMSEKTKHKLKAYGIAPPERSSEIELDPLKVADKVVECPYCDSTKTELKSEFGSTACKSLYYCNHCRQPFEHFKCH